MEELVLTTPVVIPEQVTNKYHVVSLTLNLEVEVKPGDAGLVSIDLRDNNNERSNYQYTGTTATNMIKTLNTANLTTKSLHKRVLEQLSKDGFLPGTVTGTPDPPTP